jgi:hypothetical protein
MNQSEIDIMFTTGVGIRVQESRGLLNVIIALPENYREIHMVSLYLKINLNIFRENWNATTIVFMINFAKTQSGHLHLYLEILLRFHILNLKTPLCLAVAQITIERWDSWVLITENLEMILLHRIVILYLLAIHNLKTTPVNSITTLENDVSCV